MKKMVRVELYWLLVMCTPCSKPSSLALPMLVRSRKAMRYSRQSQGMSLRSSLSSNFLSCRRQHHRVSQFPPRPRQKGIDVRCVPSPHHSGARPGPVAAHHDPAPRNHRARRRFSSRHRTESGRCRCRGRGGSLSSRSRRLVSLRERYRDERQGGARSEKRDGSTRRKAGKEEKRNRKTGRKWIGRRSIACNRPSRPSCMNDI